MIEPGYVKTMARYNAWQNAQLTELLGDMPVKELKADRGAFFGSIFATLNHLLWGDMMWMNRFDDSFDKPAVGPEKHAELTPTFAVWSAERFQMDGKIVTWAKSLRAIDLKGDLTWHSGITGTKQTQPLGTCITHLMNHQTHHRGQIHAMITATGRKAPVSDLAFMPEDT